MTSTIAQPSLLTVVVAFQIERLRNLMIKSMSRHNHVFDAYSKTIMPSTILLDVPCFFRFVDYQTYEANAECIIEHYQDCDLKRTPPLLVYGLDMELFPHPLILDAIKADSDYCLKLYRNARRRARREALCS